MYERALAGWQITKIWTPVFAPVLKFLLYVVIMYLVCIFHCSVLSGVDIWFAHCSGRICGCWYQDIVRSLILLRREQVSGRCVINTTVVTSVNNCKCIFRCDYDIFSDYHAKDINCLFSYRRIYIHILIIPELTIYIYIYII